MRRTYFGDENDHLLLLWKKITTFTTIFVEIREKRTLHSHLLCSNEACIGFRQGYHILEKI